MPRNRLQHGPETLTVTPGYATHELWENDKFMTISVWWVKFSAPNLCHISFPLLFKPTKRQIRRLRKSIRQHRALSDFEQDKDFYRNKRFHYLDIDNWTGKISARMP